MGIMVVCLGKEWTFLMSFIWFWQDLTHVHDFLFYTVTAPTTATTEISTTEGMMDVIDCGGC